MSWGGSRNGGSSGGGGWGGGSSRGGDRGGSGGYSSSRSGGGGGGGGGGFSSFSGNSGGFRPANDFGRGDRRDGGYGGGGYGDRDRDGYSRDKYEDNWDGLRDVDYRNMKDKVEIEKNFYRESEETRNRSHDEIHSWREKSEVTINDPNCQIRPILTFNELDVPPALTEQFKKNKYLNPTPIQAQSWPIALSGSDVIGIARTGSGKTLGFTVPALVHIKAQPKLRRGDGCIALILTPTRELAQQVEEEAKKFGSSMGVNTVAVYGGAPKHGQRRELDNGCEIVVACPGRLLDFIQSGVTNMKRCTFLIMDEADRMLDMGFEPQIRKILGQCRRDRQTLMFSATWPKEVRRLAEDFLTNPGMITIGTSGDELVANPNIKQIVEVVDEWDKPQKFTHFMERAYQGRVVKSIVFTCTKRACDYLAQELGKRGWPVAPIHGDKDQRQRDSTLKDFRNGRIPILIATDVAARGLDISDVEYVINYDFPSTMEDYVHRIGRTARAEAKGTAYSLLTKEHGKLVSGLIEVMEKAGQEVPDAVRNMQRGGYGGFGGKSRSGGFRDRGRGGGGRRPY